MRQRLAISAMAAGLALWTPAAAAQSGDPDRIGEQLALGHAAAIENAWSSVAARIGVTDASNLWEDEWDGASDPQVSDWWLQSWTDRGLTARYCGGVLAVYADRAELKGVGTDHRAVQVAPVVYGNARSGLHLVTQGSRLYTGAHGRDGGSLPACMPVISTTGDRVALVSAVDDPKVTPVRLRWMNEDRTVACAAPDTGTMVERRRIPIQVTAVNNCPAATPNCNDLREFVTGTPAWPADCASRETMLSATPATLPARAACTDWFRWRSNCQVTYAAAPPAADIPDAVVTWEAGPVHSWTRSCSCPAGETGTCTEHWEQNTEFRVFVLRPGVPELRTRQPARGTAGRRRHVSTDENCTPVVTNDPDDPGSESGESGDDGHTGEQGIAGDDSGLGYGHETGVNGGIGHNHGDDGDGNGGDGDGGCFLTTAVVERRGEADDGPTLTTLREFRDCYMLTDPERVAMVAEYYAAAPKIVAAIPADHPEWDWIEERIDASVAAIQAGNDSEAFATYVEAMRRLNDRWLERK